MNKPDVDIYEQLLCEVIRLHNNMAMGEIELDDMLSRLSDWSVKASNVLLCSGALEKPSNREPWNPPST